MRILIINLTRMGDLIQTMGLVNSVQCSVSSVQRKVDLLVMKAFAPIVKHFNNINEVICINDEILGSTIADDMWGASIELYKLIEQLNQNNYDIVLNPIVSQQSSLLVHLINAKKKFGMQITANREQKMTSDWTAYLLANQHNLGDHSFNLVDIFAGMSWSIDGGQLTIDRFTGFKLNVFDEDMLAIAGFTDKIKATGKKVVGFHIGASQSNKAWNIGYYHRTISLLLETGEYCIVLFGGYKEQEFKHHFADISNALFFNTIGDFKLNELIAAIDSVDLLVTNDTGPMHIASARQKPVLDISLGPVSKWETGPYNEKAIIVEADIDCHPCSFNHLCQHWNCQHQITPEVVIALIKYTLTPYQLSLPNTVKAFKVCRDQFGFQSYQPLHPNPYLLTEREHIFAIKRFIWSLYFIDKLDNFGDYYERFKADTPKTTTHRQTAKTQNLLTITKTIIADLKKVLTNEKNVDKIRSILLQVKKNKEVLFAEAQGFEEIYDWFWFLTFKESEIEDTEITKVTRKTIVLYDKLQKKLEILNKCLGDTTH